MKIKLIAAFAGTYILATEIAGKAMESEQKEALNKLTDYYETKTTAIFNDGVKFGRMLQRHDNRAI